MGIYKNTSNLQMFSSRVSELQYVNWHDGGLPNYNELLKRAEEKDRMEPIKAQDEIFEFKEGLAPAYRTDIRKWGYIDEKMNEVIEFKYDAAAPFYNGCAEVKINRRAGCIDKNGNIIIECKYDTIFTSGDTLVIKVNGKIAKADRKGKFLSDFV
ncbi:MAG: WG repeat-containing protein [Clostridiales bacterium]|nr:WG repeat-containing protein [Clostridiales bacterium]